MGKSACIHKRRDRYSSEYRWLIYKHEGDWVLAKYHSIYNDRYPSHAEALRAMKIREDAYNAM